MKRSISQILLATFGATAILWFLSGIAAPAQEVVIPSALPVESAVESAVTESPSSQPVPATSGYWIVGSHASPQSFDDSVPVFCSGVTHYDRCAGFRRTDMQELSDAIQPGVPVCIVCHGSFVSWEDVLKESRETWQWLHYACPNHPVQMIYFSWPSDRPIFSPVVQFNVNCLGRRAGRNGFYMASLVQKLPSECPICLMGHSHGTRVITSSLHLMGGGEVDGYRLDPGPFPQHRLRAVFAASAMDHNWMNQGYRYDRALCSVECILNLQNQSDAALTIYPLRHPFSGGALGYTGVMRKDRRHLGPYGHKIQDWDLTEEIGRGHYWPNYFRKPWLAKAIRSYLFFDENTCTTNADTALGNLDKESQFLVEQRAVAR